jgi:hypothetical protein
MKEYEHVFLIRLSNKPNQFLISNKKRGLKWGHINNAIRFNSKYKAKQIYNNISENAKCEIYQYY